MDDYELDEDEIESLYEGDEDRITPEDIFKMVHINKARGKAISVELKDETGDAVEVADIVEQLLDYMKEKLEDEEESDFTGQIVPLMAQAMASGLSRMVGISHTAMYLTNDQLRTSIVHMMSMSMLLLKIIQDKNLKIYSMEEDITVEEIEDLQRKARAGGAAVIGSMMGSNPEDILKQLLNDGKISKQDLQELLGEKKDGDKDIN